MSTMAVIIARFTELYNANDYAGALTYVEQVLPQQPDYEAILLCFSAAMSARLGDTRSALAVFQTAFDHGFWYHESALRGDPDFASLQAEPAFQRLIEQNAERRQAAVATLQPLCKVLSPATMDAAPLLIVLHGNLSNAETTALDWQFAVERGWRVALPQSATASWVSGFYDWADIQRALTELAGHYQALTAQYAIDPARVVLAGFSIGALVAEIGALEQHVPASGLLWIEGAVDDEVSARLATHSPHRLRAYFAAGQSQEFIPTAETLAQTLHGAGIVCELERASNRDHAMPPQDTLERALVFLSA